MSSDGGQEQHLNSILPERRPLEPIVFPSADPESAVE